MCDKIVSKGSFMLDFVLKYSIDRYKIQEMRVKCVFFFLPILKFPPDWFISKTMIKKLDDTIFSNDDIFFVNKNPSNIIFFSDDIDILSVDIYNINLDDLNFDEDDPSLEIKCVNF